MRSKWEKDPAGGRPKMVPAGDPEVVKADIVLLAMGFLKPQLPEVGENVFFAGDVQSGASLVVRAMASGHAAADALDAWCQKPKGCV